MIRTLMEARDKNKAVDNAIDKKVENFVEKMHKVLCIGEIAKL